LTTMVLEVVGRQCFEKVVEKKRGRKKKKQAGEGDVNELVLERINSQYHKFFRFGEDLFNVESGAIALRKRQGKELLEVALALPFLLFGVLPVEMQSLVELAVTWRNVVILWRKNDCSENDLNSLDRYVVLFQERMVNLYNVQGDDEDVKSVWAHPTFHDLVHVVEEKRLFGGDAVTSTQDDERAHSRFVKFVFLQETNHESGWLLFMQFWNALWHRGLMFQLANEANYNALPDGVELLNSDFVMWSRTNLLAMIALGLFLVLCRLCRKYWSL
jgi:hypothetical protein